MAKPIDITGQKYGLLTALRTLGKPETGACYKWLFQCECGNQHIASVGDARSGRVKSCGCLLRKTTDITGQKHNRLTAIKLVSHDIKKQRTKWLFRCDCGNEVVLSANAVKTGNTKSCGCQKIESSSKTGKVTVKNLHQRQVTHGHTGTRIYRIYKAMKTRCYNKHGKNYCRYGGRGIVICNEWLKDPQSFIDWAMQNGYQDNLSIDRIDFDGNYCPDNCRFITQAEQTRNTSKNRFIEFNGETKIVSEWARQYGVNPDPIYERIGKGVDPVQALMISIAHRGVVECSS